MSQDLLEVGVCLEEAVLRIPEKATNPNDLYLQYEMSAISILDSGHDQFEDDHLFHYLRDYLEHKRRQLGLKSIT